MGKSRYNQFRTIIYEIEDSLLVPKTTDPRSSGQSQMVKDDDSFGGAQTVKDDDSLIVHYPILISAAQKPWGLTIKGLISISLR